MPDEEKHADEARAAQVWEALSAGDRTQANALLTAAAKRLERPASEDASPAQAQLRLARAWLQLRAGQPAAALASLAGADGRTPAHDTADGWFVVGCAHEAEALNALQPATRRTAFEAALKAQQQVLRLDVSASQCRVASVAKAWTRAATVLLLLGELARSRHALEAAAALTPESREVALLRAEQALLAGEHHEAMEQLLPRLDSAPDGWLLAALAAHGGQLVDQMARLCSEAEKRCGSGFVAPHRRERYADAMALLSIAQARPAAGVGPYGQLGALMSGDYQRVPGGAVRGADKALVETQLRTLLLAGRTDLLVPLLDDRAEVQLPGIGELVRGVVGGITGFLSPS